MSSLLVRHLDEGLHAALRQRAKDHCRSLEAEVRAVLSAAVRQDAASVIARIPVVSSGRRTVVTRDEINGSYEDVDAAYP